MGRAALHQWEEPCLSGSNGSGAVFFSGCTMRCVFCQNRPLSRENVGFEISVPRLSEIFCELQADGAHNINLVSPTPFVPSIVEAIHTARNGGLTVPIVYNTGGYERAETIRLLRDTVDVYLPDFKYMDDALAVRFSAAPEYARYASESLAEMVRQTGPAVFDANGMMLRGVLVRHLALPGHTKDSMQILRYLHETYGDDIYISLMNQYTPFSDLPFEELRRPLSEKEYDKLVNFALMIGIQNGFLQEGGTAEESFIPSFDGTGVL